MSSSLSDPSSNPNPSALAAHAVAFQGLTRVPWPGWQEKYLRTGAGHDNQIASANQHPRNLVTKHGARPSAAARMHTAEEKQKSKIKTFVPVALDRKVFRFRSRVTGVTAVLAVGGVKFDTEPRGACDPQKVQKVPRSNTVR